MQAIRDAQVAPLGEKGSELSPADLEELPSEEQGKPGITVPGSVSTQRFVKDKLGNIKPEIGDAEENK